LLLALGGVLCAASIGHPQVSTTAVPIYHGKLTVRPATGSINRRTGSAILHIRRWKFEPVDISDGVFPDREPVIVAMGAENFRLDAGQLTACRSGRRFSYRAPRSVRRGIRRLRLVRRNDGSYRVRLVLRGVDLSTLKIERPICVPMALIVGDDDGFACVDIHRPTFTSPHISIPDTCTCPGWPWLNG
jgi:hypothetical protein